MACNTRFPDFNPRPPCGGRRCRCQPHFAQDVFQSTSSVWRTTASSVPASRSSLFQSTSSVWRTTRALALLARGYTNFNPRPPCGGRRTHAAGFRCGLDFNPRPPCGGRPATLIASVRAILFQSTSSVWRTTMLTRKCSSPSMISIHVLRVEDDSKNREKSLFAFI